MMGNSHILCTGLAFDVLISLCPTSTIADEYRSSKGTVVIASKSVDELGDVELVDVRGWMQNGGRDDPHRDNWDVIDDRTSRGRWGYWFTAFNHFIDIKKGPGIFDDYDGYSYHRGSASRDQYEDVCENRGGWVERIYELLGHNPRFKVDEIINWYLSDNYVHVEGDKWYAECSPAMTNYSFVGDKGIYSSVEEELQSRFPPADFKGTEGKGVPYSVFMPVDNLARHHYDRFIRDHHLPSVGAIMHALQDVCIPHHAAGYLGNFHSSYESDLNTYLPQWIDDPSFAEEIASLYEGYHHDDPDPSSTLSMNDRSDRTPGRNWRVDMLVTWLALNSYHSYVHTYDEFRKGYDFEEADAKELVRITIALCMIAIEKCFGL
jgi:hypothetical protein